MRELNHQIDLAKSNILDLAMNSYPGRGIVVGLNEAGTHTVQVYWIMGRSPNSRNRVFKSDSSGRLYTDPADASKMKDPSLIIYNAMREADPYYVVSNGSQTDTVIKNLNHEPFSLDLSLSEWQYEPDKPNYTPRITAVSRLFRDGRSGIIMSVLRKSPFGDRCDRFAYDLNSIPGFGFCITTYTGDGNPLPSFSGEPLLVPIVGGIEEVVNDYWEALDCDNRVSLAVKMIEIRTRKSEIRIMNKYEQVSQ